MLSASTEAVSNI